MLGVVLIDISDETAAALKADGRRTPLLLAARYTMEHEFYTDRIRRHCVDVIVPDAEDRAAGSMTLSFTNCARAISGHARSIPSFSAATKFPC